MKALRLLRYCYIGNVIGGFFIALLLCFFSLLDGVVLAASSGTTSRSAWSR